MQIRTVNDNDIRRKNVRSGKSSGSTAASSQKTEKSGFESLLEEVLPPDQEHTADLHQLWSELPDAEKKFLEKPTDANLKTYKKIVLAIAKKTLEENVQVTKIYKKSRSGEKVELSIVEYVDERIQKMAQVMHSEGNSAFRLLRYLDEIRGMLLDQKR
jgi:uncharacterized protein YaaR (DUF327 family)